MNIPIEFLEIVKEDIRRIDDAIERDLSHKELIDLHREIDAKYQGCIVDWHNCLSGWLPKDDAICIFSEKDCSKESVISNLKLFKAKLTTYSFGMNAASMPNAPQTNVNVTTNVSTNFSFETARKEIEDMTSLTSEQTKEILDKLTEIEKTVNSNDSKKNKWEKVKPVLKWLGDKSFDVAKIILPLLITIK